MKRDIDWHKEARRLGITNKMLISWSAQEKMVFVRRELRREARRRRMKLKKLRGWA